MIPNNQMFIYVPLERQIRWVSFCLAYLKKTIELSKLFIHIYFICAKSSLLFLKIH